MAWSLETLVRSPWLARQPAPVAEALLAIGRVHRLEAGQAIDRDAALVALVEGALSIEATVAGGRTVLIDLMRPGQWLGQAATMDADAPPVAARARSGALLFVVAHDALRKAGRTRADVWRSVADLAHQQLQAALGLTARLLTAAPAELIALRLVMLAIGRPPTVAVSQSELGELTGLTRKAVNAHLAALERRGLVRRAYGRVMLADLPALKRLAGLAGAMPG